ncbi:phage holin family protein [Marinilabiliaceae bacterium JC017]|nr:phage holin family protein [Marinilabiliaceae bacterium JC017]
MKENITEELNDAKKEVQEYINARVDLTKLHMAENLSRFFSGLIIKMVVFYLFFFVLLFSSLALAFWLDRALDSRGAGFLIVAGTYLIIGVFFYSIRRKLIERPVIQSFIQLFFPSYTDYDKEKK